MKTTSQSSLRRLFALLAIFTGVPLVLLVLLPLKMATNSLGHEATSRVADTAAVSSNAIAIQMQGLSGLVKSFSTRPELLSNSSIPVSDAGNPVSETLAQLQVANPNVRAALMLDPTGKLISVSPFKPANIGTDFSYRDYFKGAVNNSAPYVSETFISSADPFPKLVAVGTAIRGTADIDGQQPLLGVLVVTVDTTPVFQNYVNEFKANNGVSLTIFDQNGQIVAQPGLGKVIPKSVDSGVQAAQNGIMRSGKETRDGKHVVVAYKSVAMTGWVVSASVPQSEAFAPINSFRTRVILIAAILGSVIALALLMLARSLSGQTKTMRVLRLTEERRRKVLETVRQAFCELDTDLRITDWNAQAEVLFGWKREEVLGRLCIETICPTDRRSYFDNIMKQMVSSDEDAMRSQNITGELLKKDGSLVPVEIGMWATDTAGEIRINIFAQDISERVRLEREQELVVKRQRRLVEELRTADKAKTDFIATISHELRTPLTSIVGYLEMLEDGYGGELTANQTSMLDVIDRNSRRLLSLIEDVLTLSRIESGVMKGDSVAVDVTTLVYGAAQTFIPAARAKSLTLDVDIPKDIGWISGDHNQLERVLLNLMSNAVKFTPEGGRVAINGFRHEGTVTLSISDTGIGIPIEEQHRLFSRFFRASTAQDQAIQGTGLGLTIVKSIVERHGGTISIQSADGSGTVVLLEFPAADLNALAGV